MHHFVPSYGLITISHTFSLRLFYYYASVMLNAFRDLLSSKYAGIIGLGLMTISRILSGLTGIVCETDNVLILGKTKKHTMSDLKLH